MIATFKELPLLCNDEMVRSILDDRKTNTRRLIKPQPTRISGDWDLDAEPGDVVIYNGLPHKLKESTGRNKRDSGELTPSRIKCPYGVPGDRLWVREAWAGAIDNPVIEQGVVYRATDPEWSECEGIKWRPSIHMPRWASRINLEITNVRVERLQDISEEDAIDEGIRSTNIGKGWLSVARNKAGNRKVRNTAKECFRDLWQSIYGPQSWHDDPWVWVVEFELLKNGE